MNKSDNKFFKIDNKNNISNNLSENIDYDFNQYQKNKIQELKKEIGYINQKLSSGNYYSLIMENYINWIDNIRTNLVEKLLENQLYYFFKLDTKDYLLYNMKDYWDVPDTPKLFSFCLFITNLDNLTYLIGLVYNYAIIRKHFPDYTMRIYMCFHSIFGSPETFNLFNMFTDILESIDPTFHKKIQFIIFFLNPYYNIQGESIYEPIVDDLTDVINYYNKIIYNSDKNYIKSPLLNIELKSHDLNNTQPSQNSDPYKNIKVNLEDLEVNYININNTTVKSTFKMLSCHLSVNLRFLPMNENCEYHIRDLDSRLSLTDKNIIKTFNNPKFKYVPFYVFQFYKFYFPYLKWRIDVNPYLAGCIGGSNRKSVMISKELEESDNLKILKKELFLKYILFISFNSTNLQIGFLNDEFILANIFEKIKGKYSENILFLNLGSFTNKHVNEYYYGLNNSSNYPCILKFGIPIDILRYPLKGKYLTIDPITDFKIGNIDIKYQNIIKYLITEQINIYLGKSTNEEHALANKIRMYYKLRLDDNIDNDLEAALFFSMLPSKYELTGLDEFNNSLNYTSKSYSNDSFSSVGSSKNIIKNSKLKSTNFMFAGYLLSDILEEIIFPKNPEYINSNYFLNEDNYDRLFNCLYFKEDTKKFIQRKINKSDISRKYIDQDIIDIIPEKYIEFNNKEIVKKELNEEFNEYLDTCKYYSSMSFFLDNYKIYEYIQIDNHLIKTGILIFIKNYSSPIMDNQNNVINNLKPNDIRTLKYKINHKTKNIDSVNIRLNKLKFNLVFLDDTSLNQMSYHSEQNQDKVDIKLIKSTHLKKLLDYMMSTNYQDYIIVDEL